MSSSTITYWLYFCATENKFYNIWSETAPTVCPTNAAHIVDNTQTMALQTIDSNVVTIKEELLDTQGIYKYQGYSQVIPAGTPGDVTTINLTWPRQITLLNGTFDGQTANFGDVINADVIPATPIGYLTQNVNVGDTLLHVSPTVVQNVFNGFTVILSDGVNTVNMGECMSIDNVRNTITVQTASTQAFLASSPTYLSISVSVVNNLHVGSVRPYEIAQKKIGGKTIPAGTKFSITYMNNDGQQKNFIFDFEFIY